jgi:cell division protein FtsB
VIRHSRSRRDGIRNTEYVLTNDQRPTNAPDLPPSLERLIVRFQFLIERFYSGRRKLATVAVLVVAGMVAYHAVFGANGMVVYQQKKIELKSVNSDVEKLEKENERLSDQINGLKSDPKAIEKEAREQLRYARPGEVIYLLPGQKRADTPPPNATARK